MRVFWSEESKRRATEAGSQPEVPGAKRVFWSEESKTRALEDAGRSEHDEAPARVPFIYSASLAAGVAAVFIGGTVGLVSWGSALLGLGALATRTERQGRWMPVLGLVLGVVYAFVNARLYGHL